jgi:hypothetical protein
MLLDLITVISRQVNSHPDNHQDNPAACTEGQNKF